MAKGSIKVPTTGRASVMGKYPKVSRPRGPKTGPRMTQQKRDYGKNTQSLDVPSFNVSFGKTGLTGES